MPLSGDTDQTAAPPGLSRRGVLGFAAAGAAFGFNSYRFSIDYRGVGPNPVADAVREDRWPVDGGGEEKRPSVGGLRPSLACRTPPTLRTLHA